MIGIGDYNFDGQAFACWDGAPLTAVDRHALQAMIVDRAFNLNRWQGEPGIDGPLSVGRHSIAVGGLAALLAVREGQEKHTVEACLRYGMTHDLGETLGLGDIAAPWLRLHPELAQLVEQHQRAAEELFGLAPAPEEVARLVKTADRLAAILERRYFFSDDSGRCESPEIAPLFKELSGYFLRPARYVQIGHEDGPTRAHLGLELVARGELLPSVCVFGMWVYRAHSRGGGGV